MQKLTDTKITKKTILWSVLKIIINVLTLIVSKDFFVVTQKNTLLYFIIRIIVFFCITFFVKSVIELIIQIKNKNRKVISFIKYFLVYFLLMLFFLLLTWPRNI